MLDSWHIIKYETLRYVNSSRIYFLLLIGIIPIIIFLSLTAEKAKLEILVTNLEFFQQTLVIGFMFITYIVSILVCITIYSDLIGNEESFEFLLLSTSKSSLFIGKVLSTFVLLFIVEIESFFAFVVILLTYNISFPSISLIVSGIGITYLIMIVVPGSICLMASSFALRFNFNSSIGNYISIFIFFIIPSILSFTFFQLGLFQISMLDFSIDIYISRILEDFIILQQSPLIINHTVIFLGSISIICFIMSFIFFITTPIHR